MIIRSTELLTAKNMKQVKIAIANIDKRLANVEKQLGLLDVKIQFAIRWNESEWLRLRKEALPTSFKGLTNMAHTMSKEDEVFPKKFIRKPTKRIPAMHVREDKVSRTIKYRKKDYPGWMVK